MNYHGPYKHRARWRIAFRANGGGRLHYRSFPTKREAEDAIAAGQRTDDEGILDDLPEPIALPDDPAWVYMLLDAAGSVLYVGATRRLDHRHYTHRENGVEFDRLVFFPRPFDRPIALAIEAALIRRERPPLNTIGTGKRETMRATDRHVPRAWIHYRKKS